jgi:hypothetical protein
MDFGSGWQHVGRLPTSSSSSDFDALGSGVAIQGDDVIAGAEHWESSGSASDGALLPFSGFDASEAVTGNVHCWFAHYLEDCNPDCGGATCSGLDPFPDPCGARH